MLKLLKDIWLVIWYLPMRLWCVLGPAWMYLTHKLPIFAVHIYEDKTDKYEYNQTIYHTDKSWRKATKHSKPKPNETVVENVAICTSTCKWCNHKSRMWIRDNKTLDNIPILMIQRPKT